MGRAEVVPEPGQIVTHHQHVGSDGQNHCQGVGKPVCERVDAKRKYGQGEQQNDHQDTCGPSKAQGLGLRLGPGLRLGLGLGLGLWSWLGLGKAGSWQI